MSVAASFVAVAVGGTRHPAVGLLVFAVAAAGTAWFTRTSEASAVAGIAWLFLNDFVVHHEGRLGWDGSADVVRIGALVAAVSVARAVRRLVGQAIPARRLRGPKIEGDDLRTR